MEFCACTGKMGQDRERGLERQADMCVRLLLSGTQLASEPMRTSVMQAAKHSVQGASAASQRLCSLAGNALGVQWLLFERLADVLRSSWVCC